MVGILAHGDNHFIVLTIHVKLNHRNARSFDNFFG
jgi:hypothetical protein